ncbi:hypothetical protein [Cupriavidus lacunae]|uniref:hypothetical protein n=1 Tax=Cupriavidus lacunae TaxID=2666307 RepID=UPI000E115380|nr:hypothetical protein [Cupriavidus lacunae]
MRRLKHTLEFQYQIGKLLFSTETRWIPGSYCPAAFVEVKRWMGSTADRDPLNDSRDSLQASIVEELANRFRYGA